MSNSCVCPLAGYCERHKINKGNTWHLLCQTHQGYFDAWEQGYGPGQQGNPLTPKLQERRKRIEEAAYHSQRLRGWIAVFRLPSDSGLGDAIVRLMAKTEGKPLLRAALRQLQRRCNCRIEDATAELNRQYPYPQTSVTSMPSQQESSK